MKRGATTLLFPDIDIRYTRNLRIHDMKSDGDYLLLVLFCDRIYVLIRLIIYSYTTNSLILSFQNTVINLYGKIFLLQVDQSVQMTAFSHQGFARKICKVQSLCERHKTPKKCAFKWKDYCCASLSEVRISFVFVAFLLSIADTLGHPFIRDGCWDSD